MVPLCCIRVGEVRFFCSECGNLGSVVQSCFRACQGLGTIYSPALLDQQDFKGQPFQSLLESHVHSIPSWECGQP